MKGTASYCTSAVFTGILLVIAACTREKAEWPARSTVIIGNQEWTTRNLDVGSFRNGDPIPEAKTGEEWIQAWTEVVLR